VFYFYTWVVNSFGSCSVTPAPTDELGRVASIVVLGRRKLPTVVTVFAPKPEHHSHGMSYGR
jgi:hypothetical protein